MTDILSVMPSVFQSQRHKALCLWILWMAYKPVYGFMEAFPWIILFIQINFETSLFPWNAEGEIFFQGSCNELNWRWLKREFICLVVRNWFFRDFFIGLFHNFFRCLYSFFIGIQKSVLKVLTALFYWYFFLFE